MGIFDYIKGAAHLVTTRSGREELLGFQLYEKDRELRRRALEDFRKNYPEFKWYGDMSEFDGYVQYKKGNFFYCGLFEGSSSVRDHFDELSKEKGIDEIWYQLIAGNEIPRIKVLLSSFKDWREYTEIFATSYKINYAYLWLFSLKDEIQILHDQDQSSKVSNSDEIILVGSKIQINTHPLKKKAFEKILYLIKDGSIPFESISEILNLDKYQQFLVLAEALYQMNLDPLVEGLPYLPVLDSDYLSKKMGDTWEQENGFWRRVFFNVFSKDINLEDSTFNINLLIDR